MKATKEMTSYEIGFALIDMGLTDPNYPNTNETVSVMNLQDAANELVPGFDVLAALRDGVSNALGGHYGKIVTPKGVLWFETLSLEERKLYGTSIRYSLDE